MPHKRSKKSIRDSHTAHLGYDNAPSAADSIALGPTASTSSTLAPTTSSSSSSTIPSAPVIVSSATVLPETQGAGVLAPKPKAKKKLAPKDKLNSFGGRKDLGGLSKSAHRIFNAEATRVEYHEGRKRKREEDDKAALRKNPQKPLAPLPYETLSAFNRRVEIALRPSIDTAIRGAKAAKKLLAVKSKIKKVALADPSVVADAATANGKGKGKVSPNDSIDPLVPPVRKEKVRNGPTEFQEASQRRSITDVAMAPPTLKKARRGQEVQSMNAPIAIGKMPVSNELKQIMEFEREKAVKMYRVLKEKREKEQRESQA